MGSYKLSNDADKELTKIYRYSVLEFGIKQARKYTTGLHQAFITLANNPKTGRDCSHIKIGCRRYENQSHVIFYTITEKGILILHILGTKQIPEKHLI